MNPKSNVLIIDENVVPLTLVVIRCLGMHSDLNLHVLSLSRLFLPSFQFSRYVQTFRSVEVSDEDQAFEVIKDTARKLNVGVIIPVNERIVKIISARYKECLEFRLPPIPDLEIFNLVRNKWLLYNWLYINQLNRYKPVLFSSLINDPAMIRELTFPVLVKPHWGSGGKGIIHIGCKTDLNKLILSKPANPEELLIQPVIPGYDIDISALVCNGEIIAYTIQQSVEKEQKYIFARSVEFVRNEALLKQAAYIFRKLNYNGIAHLDFRFDTTDNSYNLVDFNARYWSSLLGSLNAGINFPWIAWQRASGIQELHSQYHCQKYYVEHNPVKILLKRIPLGRTEFFYDLSDPLPLIVSFVSKIAYLLKKNLGMKRPVTTFRSSHL